MTLSTPQPISLQSKDARTGTPIGQPWAESTTQEIDAAVAAAVAAAGAFAHLSAAARAALLRALSDALEANRHELILLADRETALGQPRLQGEFDRTLFQLRGFAQVLESGGGPAVINDLAIGGPPPAGRPHLLRTQVPLGPVAMFAVSNFPFAFSVLGGDTASALAAGCPVVVKAHPAHPELSRRVAALAQACVAEQGLHSGVFQWVQGESRAVGTHLIQSPGVAAVAFTGSFTGGSALARLASERAQPIPFFGELGSINPLVILPEALQMETSAGLAKTLAGSICLGSGQFCTSPGVIVLPEGSAGDALVQDMVREMDGQQLHPMLSTSIRAAFDRGVAFWSSHAAVTLLTRADQAPDLEPRPVLAQLSASDFIAELALQDEVFGSAALVVRTRSSADVLQVLKAIRGSLTVTLWGVPSDATTPSQDVQNLVSMAMQIAGRVLFSGVPTGVAVTAAQHHGGPFPASTAPSTTSVGYCAMDRFLRPVALQDAPLWLQARTLG